MQLKELRVQKPPLQFQLAFARIFQDSTLHKFHASHVTQATPHTPLALSSAFLSRLCSRNLGNKMDIPVSPRERLIHTYRAKIASRALRLSAKENFSAHLSISLALL